MAPTSLPERLGQLTVEPNQPMVLRRFGVETVNYFAGSSLNRMSFLRDDHEFLSAAITHPSTAIVLLNSFRPLIHPAKKECLSTVRFDDDVAAVVGSADPYRQSDEEKAAAYDSREPVPPILAFLGLDETVTEGAINYKDHYRGRPYFALDITPTGPRQAEAEKVITKLLKQGHRFSIERIPLGLSQDQG